MNVSSHHGQPAVNPFEEALDQAAALENADYRTVVDRLNTFAGALNSRRFTGVNAGAAVGLGYRVKQGQQHKMFVRVRGNSPDGYPDYTDVLFRVYVPPRGFPVVVCLFDDDPQRCNDIDQLDQALLRNLRHPDFMSRIQALVALGSSEHSTE